MTTIGLAVILILAACNPASPTPTIETPVVTASPIESSTPAKRPTKTPAENQHIREELTPSATRLPTATATPTVTPFPDYSPQKVIFEYTVEGSHFQTEFFYEGGIKNAVKMVIYENGLMILAGNSPQQKVLTPAEVSQFIDRLTKLGFFSLESNQEHDLTDALYAYDDTYQGVTDDNYYCVRVNAAESRKICVGFTGLPYVVPKMSEILSFVDSYHPDGMTEYIPDRLFVTVFSGRYDVSDETPQPAVPWPDFIPTSAAAGEIIYLEGEDAAQAYQFFIEHGNGAILQLEGREYTAYDDIIFPHEVISNRNY